MKPSSANAWSRPPAARAAPATVRHRALAVLTLAGSLGGALAGCATAPGALGPGVPVPARYEAAGARAEAPVPARWWARFGSPTLTRLVDAADDGNLDLAAATARLVQADAQARVAGAALLPVVDAGADASRGRSSGTLGGRSASAPVRTSLQGVLAASYELDLWGRNRDLLRAAQERAGAAAYAREVVRLTTRAAAANAALQAFAARDRLAIASSNLANATRVLRVVRERLNAGTGTALDVAQQESLVAGQRAAIPLLRQALDQQRTALALLLGRPPQGFAVGEGGLAGLRAPSVAAGLPVQLLVRRPDLRQAEADLRAAGADVEAARKALLPSVSLTGQGGVASSSLARLLTPGSALFALGAGLAQPVFDGGARQGQLDATVGQRQEALEAYRRAIVQALVDVENALVAGREGTAREAAQRVAVERAATAFRLAEERLAQGTIDLQVLLTTQTTLFQAQDQLVQDRLAVLQARVSLFQALGGDGLAAPLPPPPAPATDCGLPLCARDLTAPEPLPPTGPGAPSISASAPS